MHRTTCYTLTLTIGFLLMAVSASSQDWQPVDKDKLYFYQADTADHITHQLQVDSVKDRKGRDIKYLNMGLEKCDTCQGLTRITGDEIFYRIDEPFFWQRSVEYFRNAYYFYGHYDFKLNPYSPVDSPWRFRTDTSGITAHIDSVYEASVLGRADSIKRIQVSNGKTITLTKRHGILAFPAFEGDVHYRLKGVRGDTSRGKTFAFRNTYDFQPGDVFCYRIGDGSKGDNIYLGSDKQVRILDKTPGKRTLTYTVATATLEKSRISATDTLFALRRDTTTWQFKPKQQLPYEPKGAPRIHDQAHLHPQEAIGGATLKDEDPIPDENFTFYYGCRFTLDTNDRLTKILGGEKPFNDSVPTYLKQLASDPSKPWYGFYPVRKYVNGYYKKQFKRGLGLTDFYVNTDLRESYRIEMIGYVKQGDTVGTVYSDLQAREGRTGREAISRPAIQCYPNPVQQTLYLKNLSPAQTAELRLYNQMGQLVSQRRRKGGNAHLSLEGLKPGLYILRIKDGQKLIQRKVLKR